MTGVYLNQDHERIAGTLATLRHFQAFLASDKEQMYDPYSGWMRSTLTKPQAQQKLTWLVNVAINRKAGIPDVQDDGSLRRFAANVNTPRLIVRERECPMKYRARLAHRLRHPADEEYW